MFLFCLLIVSLQAYDFYIITGKGVLAEISSQTLNISKGKALNIRHPGILDCATYGTEISFVNIGWGSSDNYTLYTIDYHGNIKSNKSYHTIGDPVYDKDGNLYATSFYNSNRDIIEVSNNKVKYVFPWVDHVNMIKYDKITKLYYISMDRSYLHEQYIEVMITDYGYWRILYMIPMNYGQMTDIIPFNNTIYAFILGGEHGENQLWEISGKDFEKKRILVEYPKFHGAWRSVLVNNELHTLMHDYDYGKYWVITDLNTLKYNSRLLPPDGTDITCIF